MALRYRYRDIGNSASPLFWMVGIVSVLTLAAILLLIKPKREEVK